MLDGKVWEQGRVSVYLSWLVMLAVVVIPRRSRATVAHRMTAYVMGLAILCIVPTLALLASWQWVIWLVTCVLWVIVTRRAIPANERERWILLALLLPTAFGLAQSAMQWVPASSLLGIAGQDPAQAGVSVVQSSVRWLRAYGSFPHPNIFGGWLMLGLITGVRRQLEGRGERWLLLALPLMSLALYATFSRAAWMGTVLALSVMVFVHWRSLRVRRDLPVALACLLTVVGGMVARPDLLRTRVQSEARLEVWSRTERESAFVQALWVLRAYPLGTGVAAYRVGLEEVCAKRTCTTREPPHLVPLLALVELGWLRVVTLLGVGFLWWRKRTAVSLYWPMFTGVFVVSLFDHYVWSWWPGMTLVAAIMLLDSPSSTRQSTTMD